MAAGNVVPISSNPLPSEVDNKTTERKVRAAAAKIMRRRSPRVYFEHGHWWAIDPKTGAQYDVVDAEGGSSVYGFDLEQVAEGDEENPRRGVRDNPAPNPTSAPNSHHQRGVQRGSLAAPIKRGVKRSRRNPARKVEAIELFDYGIDGSSDFQGHGAGRRRYAVTGVGEDLASAINDALEQLAQEDFDDRRAERDLKKALRVRTWPKKPHIREMKGGPGAAEDIHYYVGLRWD